jgi:Mrp family chromosome partitioning ATPase
MAGRMGLIAPLAPPFSSDDLESAALRALDRAVHGAAAPLVLFVPARQGSGATTIALNTAYQLCDVGGYRTLFVEVDDNEGALGAILPAAAEPVSLEASYFTPFSFRQHVQRIGELDVVSGRRLAGVTGLNRWTVRRFLAAARSHYDYVLVRTPRLSHPGISTSLPSVTRTVIVATPDLPSLSVARDMSARLGQARRTVSIVMNRWDVDCAASNTAALFPAEVLSTVPDAATLVRRAQMSHNGVVGTDGPFLRAVAKIGSAIAGAPLRGRDVPNKWSLGFFSKVFTPAEV